MGVDRLLSETRISFCIPTLNRAAFIGETLDSIIAQADEFIEVVVVDGGSDEDTEKAVRSRASLFPGLRYLRSAPDPDAPAAKSHWSEGFERDLDFAVQSARGEYCWLFPDDDVLKPGAIRQVLDAAQQHHALIIVNAEVRSQDRRRVLEAQRLRMESDRVYSPWEQDRLLLDTGSYLSYMGGVVLRRDVWTSRRDTSRSATGFPHVAVIFQGALPGSALAIARPWIEIRYGNAQWYARSFEIWMILWSHLIWSFDHLEDATRSAIVPREPWKAPRRLALLRALGAYSLREYRTWILPAERRAWRRTIAKAVALMPGRVANGVLVIYWVLFRRRSRLVLADLMASPYSVCQSRWGRALNRESPMPCGEVD